MTISCFLMCSADERCLFRLVFRRHFLGIAAGGLGVLEFLVLDGKEFRAEALDLLLGGRTHVGGGDDGAEPAGGGDRLQAGDAGAHDEYLGRRHRAGRRHHHRQRPAEFFGGIDHRAIAGQIGLAGEHVHRLCAGDARHQFHGESDKAGIGHLLECGLVAVWVHDRNDQGALFISGEFAA